MRMRPDIDPLAGAEIRWPHVIEKNEGTHHAASRERQHAAHLQPPTQVPTPAFDHQIEHVCLLAQHEEPPLQQWAPRIWSASTCTTSAALISTIATLATSVSAAPSLA